MCVKVKLRLSKLRAILLSGSSYLQPQRLRAAFPRSPFQLLLLAQKDLWRGFFVSFVGALSLEPVARLCFVLPFAVKPAPRDAGNFSPRPTDSLTFLRAISV